MIQVLIKFCKGGKHYKKGNKVSFNKHDEQSLIKSRFAKEVKYKKK